MRFILRNGYRKLGRDKKAFLMLLLVALWAITMGVEGNATLIAPTSNNLTKTRIVEAGEPGNVPLLVQFNVLETWNEPGVTDYARFDGEAPYIYEKIEKADSSSVSARDPGAITLLLMGSLMLGVVGLFVQTRKV